jgi:hypothetical protein
MTNYINLKEFVDHGYLHEINRQFFHPLGLALSIQVDDDGAHSVAGIWDYRDDPEGMIFSEETLDPDKALRIVTEQKEKSKIREERLGFTIQPFMSEVVGDA